jgi:hypothetical protein
LSPVQKIFKKLTWFFLSLFRRWAGWCVFGVLVWNADEFSRAVDCSQSPE